MANLLGGLEGSIEYAGSHGIVVAEIAEWSFRVNPQVEDVTPHNWILPRLYVPAPRGIVFITMAQTDTAPAPMPTGIIGLAKLLTQTSPAHRYEGNLTIISMMSSMNTNPGSRTQPVRYSGMFVGTQPSDALTVETA